MANPLLDFTDLPLFDQVRPEHVGPAIAQLLAESEAALTAAVAPDLPADWTTLSRTLDVATEKLGRAWGGVGDDEGAAAACGMAPAAVKMQAFVVGGALSGLAGALYAHWIGFISPEQFGLVFSFELLMLAFIGGARRLAGAAWGALVIVVIPQAIAILRDQLPGDWARAAGLELVLFGAVIVAVVVLRPSGLAGGGVRDGASGPNGA